jgi:hypothetical protein
LRSGGSLRSDRSDDAPTDEDLRIAATRSVVHETEVPICFVGAGLDLRKRILSDERKARDDPQTKLSHFIVDLS